MQSSQVERSRLLGYIIDHTFPRESEIVCYFIGVYIINRTLHGRFEMQNFSSHVQKYFTE